MIIWLNGAFGSGKTTCAFELNRRLPGSFVYDPENVGYFLRRNTPKKMHKPDFQDHEQWRAFNYEMLRYLYREHAGDIIVPMTLVEPQYYEEIVQRLTGDGAVIKHFILWAERATLLKRLSKRLSQGDTWAKSQIDRCMAAFTRDITEEKIVTDGRSIQSIVEEIAARSGLTLAPDNRTFLKKQFDRAVTLIRHIR